MATTKQQKAWWKLFKNEEDYAPIGHALKRWLFGGGEIPVSNALFDLDSYEDAIISDLFGEERYFADSTKFWDAQNVALATMVEQYHQTGWPQVILHDVGEWFSKWDYLEADVGHGGQVHITVSKCGEVEIFEGYLSRKEFEKRQRGENEGEAAKSRSELTKGMQNYLALHRHAAVRAELLTHQGLALRLALAQMIAGSELWCVHADPQKANTEATKESVAASTSDQKMAEERAAVCDLLGLETLVPKKSDYWISNHAGEIFITLCGMLDEDVNHVLALVVAETLPAGSELVEILGTKLGINMGMVWSPDQAFFDQLRDKKAINAIVDEIAGEHVAKANVSATAKTQKEIIAQCLDGRRTAKLTGWTPRYMSFPMETYLERETS